MSDQIPGLTDPGFDLRALRLAKGYTLTTLTEALESWIEVVCRHERGTQAVSVPMARRYAQVYGLDVATIIESSRRTMGFFPLTEEVAA